MKKIYGEKWSQVAGEREENGFGKKA